MLDKILDFIAERLGVNHVVAEGTSGMWNYRKWSNGNAEIWSANVKVSTIKGYSYRTINLPFSMIDTSYQVQVTVGSIGNYIEKAGAWGNDGSFSKKTDSFSLAIKGTIDNSGLNGQVDIYITGKWKIGGGY